MNRHLSGQGGLFPVEVTIPAPHRRPPGPHQRKPSAPPKASGWNQSRPGRPCVADNRGQGPGSAPEGWGASPYGCSPSAHTQGTWTPHVPCTTESRALRCDLSSSLDWKGGGCKMVPWLSREQFRGSSSDETQDYHMTHQATSECSHVPLDDGDTA